ncbi:MAG TPA: ABC transporter permease [Actinomycetota bacterium]|nr:ABC transporter permease [Actinomycetota bacterium]
MEPRFTRWLVRTGTGLALAFLYLPVLVVVLYAFNRSLSQAWPPELFTTRWFAVAWRDPEVRTALTNSVLAGLGATAVSLVLGSLAAFALHRFRFFGRETISLFLVLPIALPGIVTAIALASAIDFVRRSGLVEYSLWTIIVGHATFCVVVVYNNVIARLRRTPGSLVEASMDLGADGWQTFRHVTLPNIRTALLAGGLLAFGLSFDEIVVTNFTAGPVLTLPIWIFNHLRLPRAGRPVVNVVAMVVILLSLVPVYLAQRVAGREAAGPGHLGAGRG